MNTRILSSSVTPCDACHSQAAQGAKSEHRKTGSSETAADNIGKPDAIFLARPRRGTRFRSAGKGTLSVALA
jgi:hypothetical protein